MIETSQLAAIFAFGLLITGIVGMGVMRAREIQKRVDKERRDG